MMKMIQFLRDNMDIAKLLHEGKVSLVGVTAQEQEAIVEAFAEEVHADGVYWQ
ncbi:competence pheromone ComX [Metasolibacillus sp. FSL H7-0170]|uniref:competence pheromone ComX n=1 Tax=Metasolibacillus TaxID=2703677 RepID=UPI000D3ABE4E|nr:competence pheromone ComX [Metasolibacillus fluoroglycofenilyticus]